MAECVGRHELRRNDALIGPISVMAGNKKWKPGKIIEDMDKRERTVRSRIKHGISATEINYADPDAVKRAEQKDARILQAAQMSGIFIDLG